MIERAGIMRAAQRSDKGRCGIGVKRPQINPKRVHPLSDAITPPLARYSILTLRLFAAFSSVLSNFTPLSVCRHTPSA